MLDKNINLNAYDRAEGDAKRKVLLDTFLTFGAMYADCPGDNKKKEGEYSWTLHSSYAKEDKTGTGIKLSFYNDNGDIYSEGILNIETLQIRCTVGSESEFYEAMEMYTLCW